MRVLQSDNIIFSYNAGSDPIEERFSRHCHNSYEILLFVNGNADYVVENSKYSLKPFDMLVIKPAQYHFFNFNSYDKYERFIINFSEKIIPENIAFSLDSGNRFFHLNENDDMARMFFRIDDCSKRYDEHHQALMLKSIMTEMLLSLNYATEDSSIAVSIGPVVDRIINYINENLTIDLNIDTIADNMKISPSHLSHVFNKAFGISIMQYIRQKKILYAQSLIQSGVRPSVAYTQCGFNNYATFYRAYKQMIGTIPSE